MEQAIKKAIKVGYEGDQYGGVYTIEDYLYSKEKVLLDPLFWIALGKAEGWDGSTWTSQYQDGWLYHWHRFIDHIAEGKSVDDFFNQLLKS